MTGRAKSPALKTLAKKVLRRVHLYKQAARMHGRVRLALRDLRRTDSRIAARYLAEASEPKLHIGCGDNLLDGWLNSDLHPRSKGVLRLDVTRPFPFADDTFTHAYSEHLLGSITFRATMAMLSECFRVLAPGGKLRITTFDLAFLIDLYRRERSELEEQYLKWAADTRLQRREDSPHRALQERASGPLAETGFLVNHTLHSEWGLFVYDEPILRCVFESAGFQNVVRCDLNQSEDAALCGLANEGRLPAGFLRLESVTLEGSKP